MAPTALPAGRRTRPLGLIPIAIISALALILTPAGAQAQQFAHDEPDGAEHEHLDDFDTRTAEATIAPTADQLDLVDELSGTARWTQFGTIASLIRHGDYLTAGVPGADPTAAATGWLAEHGALFGLDTIAELRPHAEVPLTEHAYTVVLRQYAGGLPVSPDGFASVGLTGSPGDWRIAYVSSTLVPQAELTGSIRLGMGEALTTAAADAGTELAVADLSTTALRAGWRVLDAEGIAYEQLVRPVGFPTMTGISPAYETIYFDGHEGYRHIVDAATGEVHFRESIVHEHQDNPTWEVYSATPPMSPLNRPPWSFPGTDRRELWCWTPAPGCHRVLENDAAVVPWDVDARTGEPTFTTTGNAVDAAEFWTTSGGAPPGHRPTSTERDYRFPLENVWYETRCHSDNLSPGGNDIDAAVTNLFANTSRLHNWSYRLGFTEETWNAQAFNFGVNPAGENDPVIARAQAGAIAPGSRNNATMATRPDGTSSIMSMFLWHPQANAFVGPCVIGDFDMTVIGHEYTHMIENRLIGNGGNRSGFHAGAMGESWSDFISMEYLNEYGMAGRSGINPWTVGAYATGSPERGIRNYNMSYPSAGALPQPGRDTRVGTLNFGSMGYDIVGPQVHADSQIWSATNYDLRQLLLERYPSEGVRHQQACADGLRELDDCPGNRRWIQLVFDAMLLMPTAPTMLDARDAYFAADLLRFDGANQDLLWLGFARRGFGETASVGGVSDTDPVPSFGSPHHEPATLSFQAVAKDEGGTPIEAEVYVGHYEARATPLQAVEQFVPHPQGYTFVAHADGYGHVRFQVDDLAPGEERTITIHFPTNVASQTKGATASGDGVRHGALIDDTEATNWQRTGAPVAGAQVTIALDGEQEFTQAKASAMLLPGQNRFTALRQFELYTCTAGGTVNPTCDGDTTAGWDRILRSERAAFPAPNPRPSSPDLILRTFDIPTSAATHVKFVALTNQCTGNPNFQGDQHNDPNSPSSDCRSASAGANEVRAAALQLLTSAPHVEGASLVQ